MKLALINPNRLQNPPVIPVGLEYLAHSLRQAGHEAEMIDLCFATRPIDTLIRRLDEVRPDAAFLSIRNLDSAVRAEENCYLDEHWTLGRAIRRTGVRLIVGGAAVAAMPTGIRRLLHATCVVVGPGERAGMEVAARLAAGKTPPPIVDGFAAGITPNEVFERATDIDYAAYYAKGGVAGFASSYGCTGSCEFCLEAHTRFRGRDPKAVAAEVRSLVKKGWRRLHLCDAELNVTYKHAWELCQALRRAEASWAAYLRPKPMDAELAKAMQCSGCEMATVTVNSATDRPAEAAACVRLLKDVGVKVAVDLSCGLPEEKEAQAQAMIDALDAAKPDRVGVNTQFRVYPSTALAARLRRNSSERKHLRGDRNFVNPAVYERFEATAVQRWIKGRKGFALETGEAVNYQRLARGREE